VELTTQMYFPGEELNEKDKLLLRKPQAERELMIAKRLPGEPVTYEFEIVIEKV